MRVALVTSEAGAAAAERVLAVARAMRGEGHQVTFVVPQAQVQPLLPAAAPGWLAEGFAWIPVSAGQLPQGQMNFPVDPDLATARALSSVVLAFDVAWFFDAAWAMPALRTRRFMDRPETFVVLEDASDPAPIPSSLSEINRAFAREYSRKWADLICTQGAEAVQQVETLWRQYRAAPAPELRRPLTSPAVTVCIPYFEAPEFLAETLVSLERQTSTDFTVVVVDDGSHTAPARAEFDACAARYASLGWRFVRQSNQSSGAARNRAAQESATEFVLFLDADDIAMPTMIERFLHGAFLTGDECLVAPNYGFRDDPEGPCEVLYDPPGNSLVASMGDDMHGGSCILIRRESFLSLGGFTEIRGVGFEDYEFHVRANLEKMRWDILPEFVYRYRMPRVGGVSRSTSAYPNLARVLRWYEERLRPFGLGQLPLAFASAYWQNDREKERVDALERRLSAGRAKRSPQGRELKLLLLSCNFPFGFASGSNTRVQQMIRYFGSRYELTLMTTMPREQLAPLRKTVFSNLHAVLGVEGSNKAATVDPEMPMRVKEYYTDTFQAAIRSLPTDRYHATILDQIFLAEVRKDIDSLTVLSEQNIESILLRQASERSFSNLPPGALPEAFRNAFTEAVRLERYEDEVWPQFPLRAVVSETDRVIIERRAPGGTTVVAPNGADLSNWLTDVRFDAQTVLFAGHLGYLPNVDGVDWLLEEIWPAVHRLRPGARLIIAGRTPSDAMKAAVEASSSLGVELCPSPDSMSEVARRASITIAPLRLGSGTRVKILDSMSWGLPVVSTSMGAEGINVVDGEHLLLRDDPKAFAEGMVQLLSEEALWQRCRQAGRDLIQESYSWDRVFEPFEKALLELIR